MNGLPYYKAYPRDFIEGTIGMSFELKGAYRLVLDLIYMQGGELPDDSRYISGLIGCSVKKWTSLRATLVEMDKIQVSGKFLTNYRAITELESLRKLQGKQAKNRSKPNKNKVVPSPKPDHTEPEPEPDTDKKEKRTNVLSLKRADFNALEFAKTWNDVCGKVGLPRVVKIDGQRKQKAAKRWREDFGSDPAWWRGFCDRVAASDFLSGRQSDWSATFDWCLEPRNLTKIMEGNYDNKRHATASERIAAELGLDFN